MNVNGDEMLLASKLAWVVFPGYVIYVIVVQGKKAFRLFGQRDRK